MGTSASSVSESISYLTGQAILEADLFDLEVLLQELELLLKRHGRRAGTIEGKAEQIAQAADHAVGGIRIRVHERRDRVQAC